MHEHDMDLIMALAEGTLGEADAAAAESRLAGCDRCLADLALQRAALSELQTAPRAYLTAAESTRLRTGVRKELHLADPVATATRRPRRLAFGALAGAAAVLVAIVVAGPALDLLGTGDEPSTALDDVALAPVAPDLDVPDEESAVFDAAAPSAPLAGAEVGEVAPSIAASREMFRFESNTDLAELKALIIEQGAVSVQRMAADGDFFFAASEAADSPELAAPAEDTQVDEPLEMPAAVTCDPESISDAPIGSTAAVLGSIDYEGIPAIVIAYLTDPIEDTRLFVLDAATCDVLADA